jgi:hypothetical protein
MTDVVHRHHVRVIDRNSGRERALLIGEELAEDALAGFRFAPELIVDGDEVTARLADFGLLGFGETVDEALDDLVGELDAYADRFLADDGFYRAGAPPRAAGSASAGHASRGRCRRREPVGSSGDRDSGPPGPPPTRRSGRTPRPRKTMSDGRWRAILRDQLRVSAEDFWKALRREKPVSRPSAAPDETEAVAVPAWTAATLSSRLHMSPADIAALGRERAVELAEATWSWPLSEHEATRLAVEAQHRTRPTRRRRPRER